MNISVLYSNETNETYERYVFNSRSQGTAEPIEDYVTALRTLSKTCNFCDYMRDSLVRDCIFSTAIHWM